MIDKKCRIIFCLTGEDERYTKRVFLIYDGIHYDPLGIIASDGTPVQTVFDSKDDIWIAEAQAIGNEARKVHNTQLTQYFNTFIEKLTLDSKAKYI